jgi:hypothetical protein
MKALSARAVIVATLGVLLVVWLGRPVCTHGSAGSTLPEFRALTSFPTVVI